MEQESERMTQREKLIEILSRYFTIGDSYEYSLLRVKSAFAIGTMSLEDFVEFDDEKVADIADYLLANGVAVLPSGVDDADELTASILHCLEIADADNENVCAACKQDHLRLASWLNELKQRRSEAEAALKKMEDEK